MGEPIPVTVMGRTIYVCCDDCVETVRKNPQKYDDLVNAQLGRRNDRGARPGLGIVPQPLRAPKAIGQVRCPVTGEELGSMGPPIPVTVQGRTIYVCCESCVAAVKRNPAKYFQKVDDELRQPGSHPMSAPTPSAGIQAANRGAQKLCPVTGEELGSMGPPIPVTIGSQTIYVCCQACVNAVKRSPDEFIRRVEAEIATRRDVRPTTTISSWR
jgi:YHS domain-containing protein